MGNIILIPHFDTGEFWGYTTDELEKFGLSSYIEEFVSGGPESWPPSRPVQTPESNPKLDNH